MSGSQGLYYLGVPVPMFKSEIFEGPYSGCVLFKVCVPMFESEVCRGQFQGLRVYEFL